MNHHVLSSVSLKPGHFQSFSVAITSLPSVSSVAPPKPIQVSVLFYPTRTNAESWKTIRQIISLAKLGRGKIEGRRHPTQTAMEAFETNGNDIYSGEQGPSSIFYFHLTF
jgi:hypothetical protein